MSPTPLSRPTLRGPAFRFAGAAVVAKYRNEPPYAYVVPQDQHDPVAAVELLRRLAFNGLRVSQLREAGTIDGIDYAAGTWVVPMDQEFAELARQLLDIQQYPDLREYPEGPPEQPYDASGWILSAQMGVHVVVASQPLSAALRARLDPVSGNAVDWRGASGSIDASARLAPGSSRQIIDGVAEGRVPGRFAGGIGDAGVQELDRFVRDGGTLAGMPERANVFFGRSPVFTVEEEFEGAALFSGNVAAEAPTDTGFWKAPSPEEGEGGGGRR